MTTTKALLRPATLFKASSSVPPLGLRTELRKDIKHSNETWSSSSKFTIRAQPTWLQIFSPGRTRTDSNKCLNILNGKHKTEICLYFYLHFIFLYILLWGQPLYHDLLWPNRCFCMKYNSFDHVSVTAEQNMYKSAMNSEHSRKFYVWTFFCCTITSCTITSFLFVWEGLGQRKGVTFLVLCSFFCRQFLFNLVLFNVCVKFVVQQ